MRNLPAILSALFGSLAALACSSNAPYSGPPPEYEPPRPLQTATATAAPAVEAPAPASYGTPEELGKHIDAYMAGYGAKWGDAYAPSGVLVVADQGKPIVVRTYGKADREKGTDFSIDTPLRIGSLTKQFTAAAVLKLVEEGKVATNDSVRKWVKELPDTFEPVTVHHLLNQTSGIPSYTDDPAILARKGETVPNADIIGWVGKKPLDFAPGSRFSYSNSNYYLLSLVVERAAKKPLAAVLKDQVLTPSGMKLTGVDTTNTALGYVRDPAGKLKAADVVSDSLPLGAGYLRSSASDLLRWDRALAGDTVLSRASKDALFKPGSKCPECGGDYAYGWILDKVAGSPVEWHNGAIDGFSSFFARAPEKGLAVVFLSNTMEFDSTSAGRAVLKMALSGETVPAISERDITPLDEAFAKSVAGEYILSKKSHDDLGAKMPKPVLESIEGMDVKWESGALTFKPVGQGRFGLRRASDGVLFNGDLAVDLTPDFGDGKKPEKKAKGFTLRQGPITAEYVRGKLPAKKKPETKPASATK